MASFSDTVRFCFPQPQLSPTSDDLPLSTSNGTSHRRRERAEDSFTGRQEPEDLGKGAAKISFAAIVRSYALDWLLVVALWGLLAILNRSGGHKREFSLKDISIQHTFAEQERVPPNLLALVSVGIPLVVLLPLSVFISRTRWDIHNAMIGLFMSYTMTGVVTQIVKMMVGRPRPDLISRCLPPAGSKDHPLFGLSTIDICTSTNKRILDDGFKSFPSGHSSLSFAGLGFLSLYLAGKMHLHHRRGHRTRAWYALTPLLGAAMVAISRTMDNRHHWQDVLVGSTLGLSIAWVSYRTYYPPLAHAQCHLPLAPLARSDSELEDTERGLDPRVRLLSEEEAEPRASEEQVAWRQ